MSSAFFRDVPPAGIATAGSAEPLVGPSAGGREELLGRGPVRVVSGSKRPQEHAAGRTPDPRVNAAGRPAAERG